MKTKQSVLKEITDLTNEGANFKSLNKNNWTKKCEAAYKIFGSRCDFLRAVVKYLDSEPREEFVVKQLADCEKKDKYIDENFQEFLKHLPKDDVRPIPEKKAEWYRLNNRTAVKLQLRTLNYILN